MIYVLGVAVVCIWGVAIYRIVAATNVDEELMVKEVNVAPVKSSIPLMQPDTFQLLLNYSDPFNIDGVNETPLRLINGGTEFFTENNFKPVTAEVDVNPVLSVKYIGYIWNPLRKKKIAILNQDGADRMLALGERFNLLRVIAIEKEFVEISYKSKSHIIKLGQ